MTPRTVHPAEFTATTIAAIAKALVEAANDFGEGNQIGGDVLKLAGAAMEAAEPRIRAAERERIRELAFDHCCPVAIQPGVLEPVDEIPGVQGQG